MNHEVIEMPWQEAYPASSGIKCVHCGLCSLGWFQKPDPLTGECKAKDQAPPANQTESTDA